MLDRPFAQAPAHGEAGLPGPDDDGSDPLHRELCVPSGDDGHSTSTVTLVGLVTMS